jgi:hypothetical protein
MHRKHRENMHGQTDMHERYTHGGHMPERIYMHRGTKTYGIYADKYVHGDKYFCRGYQGQYTQGDIYAWGDIYTQEWHICTGGHIHME